MLTGNDGSLSTTDITIITVNPAGAGSIQAYSFPPPASNNLSTEGTADWSHWGLTSATSFDRKSGATQQISNYTNIGNGSAQQYAGNVAAYSWTGGTPTASATNTKTGIFVLGLNNGFQITAPADTTTRTLKVYVGLSSSGTRFEASLSDGSIPAYVDTTQVDPTGANDRVYTLNYKAASAGQTLTVKWTMNTVYNGSSAVSLHAATLVGSIAPPVNQAPQVNAGNDQAITLPANATLNGTASDDGLPNPPAALSTTWSKVSGPGTVNFGNANALNTTASFSTAGTYVLRLTASDSVLATTDDVTVTVNAAGQGVLSVTGAAPPAGVNLTTEGTADWAHWGQPSATSFNHKSGVTQQIGNYTRIGSVGVQQYGGNTTLFNWTGGTPTATGTNVDAGLWVTGVGNGYQVTVPADTTARTLKMYVGLWAAGGRFEASLSDGSAPVYVDTSLVNASDTSNRVYTLSYQAASAGQTLTVRWTLNQALGAFSQYSNVTLQAASLVAGPPPTPTPTPSPTPIPPNQSPFVAAGGDLTITLPASATLNGTASDDGLPNPPATLPTTWSKVSGSGTVNFGNANALNTTASFSTAGTYVLRLTASDSVLATTDDVTVTVNAAGQGVLSVTGAAPPAGVNLTTEGTADWAHWGQPSATSFNHKSGVTQQIGNYTRIGSVGVQQYGGNTTLFNWTGGTPTATGTNVDAGLWVTGVGNGYQVTVPADTTARTLKMYVGLWAAGGRFEASLSDGSAPVYVDTSLVNASDTSNRVYTLSYQAASAGQTLTVRWTLNQALGAFSQWSNVTLQAASLAGGVAPTPTPTPSPTPTPPVTSEFQISSNAAFAQWSTHVASDPVGNFVAVWQSNLQDGSGWGIFGRRYDSAGNPLGNEFQVNTFTPGNQFVPRVAMDANDNFTVVWESTNSDGNGYGISCRRYNSAGTPLGNEVQVNTTVVNNQHDPFIAMRSTGESVIVWVSDLQDGSGWGIYGQRYDASGNKAGSEFQLNSFTAGDQKQPSVAMDSNGNFAVEWESVGQDGSGGGVYARRFNASGVAQGSEFRVNTFTTGDQNASWISMNSSGAFIITWSSVGQDGSGVGIYAQRYNAAGTPQGSEFRANTFTASDQIYSTASIDDAGNFVIVWESVGQDGSGRGVYGQRYNSAGLAQGAEFQINVNVSNDQFNPFVAMFSTNDFIVNWTSFGQDGFAEGVYGRRYFF